MKRLRKSMRLSGRIAIVALGASLTAPTPAQNEIELEDAPPPQAVPVPEAPPLRALPVANPRVKPPVTRGAAAQPAPNLGDRGVPDDLWLPNSTDISELFASHGRNGEQVQLPDLLAPPEAEQGDSLGSFPTPLHLVRTGLQWERNPFAARTRAIRQDKFLLVMFGGWDWSERSNALAWEVFSSAEFAEFAERDLVLCAMPVARELDETHEKILRFREHFEVKGLPYAVLLDPKGNPFFRKAGYFPGKARSYLDVLVGAVAEEKEVRTARREKLGARGYRQWQGASGVVLYAKLVGENSETDRIELLDEFGVRRFVDPGHLGERDRKLLPHLLEVMRERG